MTFRGFISIDIEATDEIRRFMDDIEKTRAALKMVDPEKIHITVKFLGDTEEDMIDEIGEKMNGLLSSHEPFRLNLKGAGAFPHLNYMKVVWVGTEDKPVLEDIAHEVEEELVPLRFSRMEKGFSPHITVARVKGGKNKNRLKAAIQDYEGYEFGEQEVSELKLKKSVLKDSGPVYTTIEEYPL